MGYLYLFLCTRTPSGGLFSLRNITNSASIKLICASLNYNLCYLLWYCNTELYVFTLAPKRRFYATKTCGCNPSLRAWPSFSRRQITLLGDRHIYVWRTCLTVLPDLTLLAGTPCLSVSFSLNSLLLSLISLCASRIAYWNGIVALYTVLKQ